MNTTIQPVDRTWSVGKCMSSPSSYASRMPYGSDKPRAVAALALRELESARARDIALHEKNLPAMEVNKVIAARITELMTEVGMPASYTERDTKSRARYPKTIRHDAGYLGDLRRHCVTDDGFAHATSTYERLLTDYQAYATRAEAEAAEIDRKKQREAERVIERRKADMELAALLLRYELPLETSWSDALDALAGRDQRLNLAVAMAQTRGDWSEGPYRVRGALGSFDVVTTEDKDIANDILHCLEDFEDGRVFRDTTWNYSRLFAGAADQQLSADVQLAMSRAGDHA